jgi:hypothetical protein
VESGGAVAKIFISYKRNKEPDTPVANAVHAALDVEHEVFIDTTIQVGEKWAQRIQREIKAADYLVVFLSEYSVDSEMVIAEIETAHQNNKEHGNPAILPVRLAFDQALVYPLSAYLNPLQWAQWESDSDTHRLIEDLKQAIDGGDLHDKAPDVVKPEEESIPTAFANIPSDLGSPEGTMPHRSPFYIEREGDHEAMDAICHSSISGGVTITIKGPRQMGKSSLLIRVMQEGCGRDMRAAFLDFQMIEGASMDDPEVFYRQFCSLLAWEFELEDRTEEVWKAPLGTVQKTTNYMLRYILKVIPDAPVLLAMDEVERMFASPFRSDFFSMLRSWHNRRAQGGDWTRLNLALVTSTEPYQLIADLNQSPFNVGTVVELTDFTPEQVTELHQRHGGPLKDADLEKLTSLLGGHPYLTRKALYLLASGRISLDDLLATACEDDGPFGDHLRNHLYRMSEYPELKTGLMGAIKHQRIADEGVFFRLRGAGLVRRVGNDEVLRNLLYAEYFGKMLV